MRSTHEVTQRWVTSVEGFSASRVGAHGWVESWVTLSMLKVSSLVAVHCLPPPWQRLFSAVKLWSKPPIAPRGLQVQESGCSKDLESMTLKP